MRYKALFLDVDDTLVLHGMDNIPSPRVTEALDRCVARGIHVCIATSRPLHALRTLLLSFSRFSLCVITGGAQLYDPKANRIIQSIYLPHSLWGQVLDIAKRRNLSVGYFDGSTDNRLLRGALPTGRVIGWFYPEVPPGMADEVMAEAEKITGASAHRMLSWDKEYVWIDVTSEKATKLHGITEVAKRLGISTHEMIGVGDGYNDFPLLMACGLKIAMGNAVPELKAIADFVAPPVEEDGVATVIEKFILT